MTIMSVVYSLWSSKIIVIVANNYNGSNVYVHMYLERVTKQLWWKKGSLSTNLGQECKGVLRIFCKSENISKENIEAERLS